VIQFSVDAAKNVMINLGKIERYGSDYLLIDPTDNFKDIESLIQEKLKEIEF